MRHGLTLGELAHWFVQHVKLDVDYEVSQDGRLESRRTPPGFGWPLGERTWINPSPNAANLWMARCYAGTVMLEGTTLSEGRGTTRPLELFGAPDLQSACLLSEMEALAPAVAARLPAAPVLVRTDVPQTRRQALRGHPDPCRRSELRPRELSALAIDRRWR